MDKELEYNIDVLKSHQQIMNKGVIKIDFNVDDNRIWQLWEKHK